MIRIAALAALLAASAVGLAQPTRPDLGALSLEELANVTVTSVSGREEPLSAAPASIYVITGGDIRRSGATSLAEALRLAPNLQVARVDARTYAISARGFNNAIGNKLLVLIDGRTVYSPLFSGVFWDQQDVMLEDVERIEVISGPGATLWGANAVNGVINVITRGAGETQGALASVVTGDTELGYAARYGGKLGESGAYRVYGRFFDGNRMQLANGTPLQNAWSRGQAGFRADWGAADNRFTLQGDAYSGRAERTAFGTPDFSGANLLGRWTRRFDDGANLRVQAYWDSAKRDELIQFRDDMRVFDFEAQYALPAMGRHHWILGAGHRTAHDNTRQSLLVQFIPQSKNLRWTNVFAQDEIRLSPKWTVTLGAKLESNVYTGWELLPSARVAWKPDERQLVWGALSRAVRAPARLDREFFFPGNAPFLIRGGPNFVSEVSNVVELGYRAQPTKASTVSLTLFKHSHEKLRSGQVAPAVVQNMIEGKTTGLEAWGSLQVTQAWKLSGGLTTLSQRLRVLPGSTDPTGPSAHGNDPDYQWMLRSQLDLGAGLELDAGLRRVASLPNPMVPAYTALDLRLGWRINRELDLSLIVRNANDPWHPEFGAAAGRSDIPRSTLLRLVWKQ